MLYVVLCIISIDYIYRGITDGEGGYIEIRTFLETQINSYSFSSAATFSFILDTMSAHSSTGGAILMSKRSKVKISRG